MLDGVHAHRAFADRGRALDRLHVLDRGVDRRLVLQILAFEFDPGIGRRRLDFQRHLLAGVQRGAAERSGFGEGVLKLGGRHERYLTEFHAADQRCFRLAFACAAVRSARQTSREDQLVPASCRLPASEPSGRRRACTTTRQDHRSWRLRPRSRD